MEDRTAPPELEAVEGPDGLELHEVVPVKPDHEPDYAEMTHQRHVHRNHGFRDPSFG